MMKRQKIWSLLLIIAILTGMFVSAVPVSAETVTSGTYSNYDSIAELLTFDSGVTLNDDSKNKRVEFGGNVFLNLDAGKDYRLAFTFKSSANAKSNYSQIFLLGTQGNTSDRVLQTDNITAGGPDSVIIEINNTDTTLASSIKLSGDAADADNKTYTAADAVKTVAQICFRVSSATGRLYYDPAFVINEVFKITGTVNEGVSGVTLTGSDGTMYTGVISDTTVTFTGVPAGTYTVSAVYASGYSGKISSESLNVSEAVNNAFTVTASADASLPDIEGTVSVTSDAVLESPYEGDNLTAITDQIMTTGDFMYQWQYADNAEGSYTDIDGATAASYTIEKAYIDKVIRVKVTQNGTKGEIFSTPTSIVSAFVPAEGTYTSYTDILKLFTFADGVAVTNASGALSFDKDAFMQLDNTKDYIITCEIKSSANNNNNTQVMLLDSYNISSRIMQMTNGVNTGGKTVTVYVNNNDTSLPSKIIVPDHPLYAASGDGISKKSQYLAIHVTNANATVSSVKIQEVSSAKAEYVGKYVSSGVNAPMDSADKLTEDETKAGNIATAYSASFSNVSESVKSHPTIEWTIDFADTSITNIGTARKIIPIDETKITDWSKFGLVINGAYLDENDAAVSAVLRSSAE